MAFRWLKDERERSRAKEGTASICMHGCVAQTRRAGRASSLLSLDPILMIQKVNSNGQACEGRKAVDAMPSLEGEYFAGVG